MIVGPHIQNTPTGKYPGEFWEVMARMPARSPVKLNMAVERLVEIPPHLTTWYRWVAPHQNVDWGNLPQFVNWALTSAAETLALRPDLARRLDILQDPMNEYVNEGHVGTEVQKWVDYAAELCRQWAQWRDRHEHLRDITLALAGMPPGNGSIKHIGYAQVATQYRDFAAVDYHAYWPTANKVKMPDSGTHPNGGEINEWKYFSGRWDMLMDREWAKHGYKVRWCFGEGGPIRDDNPWRGSMMPHDGWRHPGTCNGDLDCYWNGIEQWIRRAVQTPAYKEGRIIGGLTLFTTGAPRGKDAPDWDDFETGIGEWRVLAQRLVDLSATLPQPGTQPVPQPDPPPSVPVEPPRRRVVVNLLPNNADVPTVQKIVVATHEQRQTMAYSADDAVAMYKDGSANSTVVVWERDSWQDDIVAWLRARGVQNIELAGFEDAATDYIIPAKEDMPLVVDISKHQRQWNQEATRYEATTIDWDALGAKGVLLRTTFGIDPDPAYPEWLEQARANHLPHGNYHFLTAHDPHAQVAAFLSVARSGRLGDWLDVERWAGGTPTWLQVKGFCDAYYDATGQDIGIYTSVGEWETYIRHYDAEFAARHKLWVANWGVDKPRIPRPWRQGDWGTDNSQILFWQHTVGPLSGFANGTRPIDQNVFHGSAEALDNLDLS